MLGDRPEDCQAWSYDFSKESDKNGSQLPTVALLTYKQHRMR